MNGQTDDNALRRISVVGSTGSGKTTLAGELARRLGVPHIELDALHWEAGWTPASVEDFRWRATEALAGDAWAADGNYKAVRDIVWGRADTVVWLDYSLPVILRRLISRTARRVATREELWNGNRERLKDHLFTRDSLLLWAVTTYRRRRREFPVHLARPEYAHLQVVRLRTPRAAEVWLKGFAAFPPEKTVRPAEKRA